MWPSQEKICPFSKCSEITERERHMIETEIIVAIIGVIEATIVAILPFAIQKYNQKKSRAIAKTKILPHFVKPINDKEIDADVNQILDQAIESFKSSSHTSVYLRKYDATIVLHVEGGKISVKSAYTLCFVNPYGVDYTYRRKPMLRHGLQYNSYCWKNVTYQGKPCSEYIHKYPGHQTQTPNDKFLFKTGLEVPIAKDCPESVLHYSSEYITESASFFNSFRFWHHCKMFNIDVSLVGPDAHKYEIQWEIFLSTNRKNTSFERNIHYNEPDHVCLSDSGWIFPSDGYVITINKIS